MFIDRSYTYHIVRLNLFTGKPLFDKLRVTSQDVISPQRFLPELSLASHGDPYGEV